MKKNLFNKKNIIFSLTILLLIFSLSILFKNNLFAQETDEDDIYSEEKFDKEFEEKKEEASKNVFNYLFGGSINFSNNFNYFIDDKNYKSSGSLAGSIFGYVSYTNILKLFIKYTYSYNLYYFSDKNPTVSIELDKFNYFLSEFYFDYNVLPFTFIRIGKQLISWGPSFLWTPVDFINLERFNFIESSDNRSGKPSVRIHVPIGRINIFTFFDFYGLNDSSINYDPSKIGFATRVDFPIARFEIGFIGYFRKEYQPKIGMDFSGTLFSYDIFGEISYYNGYFIKHAKKGTFPNLLVEELPELPSIQMVFGISKSFLEDKSLLLSLTFFYNSQGYKIEDIDDVFKYIYMLNKNISDYFIPFYYGKYYVAFSISKGKLLNDHLSLGINFYGNLTDNSYIAILSTNWSFGDYPVISLKFTYNFGEDKGEFTYPENKVLKISLSTVASF